MTVINSETLINFSAVQFDLPSAGPGLRTEVFFFGCERDCPECINKWVMDQGLYRTERAIDLAKYIIEAGNPNISISGGEPFNQVNGLFSLMDCLWKGFHALGQEVNILVYTGNSLRQIEDYGSLLACFAKYLVTGEYIKEFAYVKLENSFVGSRNQVVYNLPFYKPLRLDRFGRLEESDE